MVATTCLFTGMPTGGTTREEHTILRALAGRFRSVTAASSSFNNATSPVLDAPLADAYALIMNALAPLLSSEHQPGALEVVGSPNERLVLAPGAVARLKGLRIEERDPITQRPTAMSGEDPNALAALARQVGIPDERLHKTTIPPVASQHVQRRQPIVSPWTEVAVLKCALLTFDHLLHSSPDAFTRSADLQPVRDAIRAIVEGADPGLLVSLTSLGIDNSDRAPLLELADLHRPRPRSSFENLLQVVARRGGLLDLHCLIAGVDVYRFRICTRWSGATFGLLCGAGMLAGDVPYGPIELNDLVPMGPPTMLRSVFPPDTSQEVVDEVGRMINRDRQRAFAEAVLLVELTADEFVVEHVRALEAVGASSLEQALRRRIGHLYADTEVINRDKVTPTVDELVASLPLQVRSAPPTYADPHVWLDAYRRAIARLRETVGMPELTLEISMHSRPVRNSVNPAAVEG